MSARYVELQRPWRLVVDVTRPEPARFLLRTQSQALRYGLPARHRLGAARALAARAGVPVGPLASMLRRLPRRARPDLDTIVGQALEAWPRWRERSPRLPDSRALSVLVLERSAARTLFLFGAAAHPLVVVKFPRGDETGAERDDRGLREAEPAGVAPLSLARLGPAFVQEGVPGAPLRFPALRAAGAAAAAWDPALASVAAGLVRLGEATAKPVAARQLAAPVERALADPLLDPAARRALTAAWRDVRAVEVSVLRHHDTSPQNCLVDDSVLSAIVDWEMAVTEGAPAFDMFNLLGAWLEHGLALREWSDEAVVRAYAEAASSPLWRHGRTAAFDAARAAGWPEDRLDALEVVFYGSRVGDRLLRPGVHPTSAPTAAALLHLVAG